MPNQVTDVQVFAGLEGELSVFCFYVFSDAFCIGISQADLIVA